MYEGVIVVWAKVCYNIIVTHYSICFKIFRRLEIFKPFIFFLYNLDLLLLYDNY